MYQQQEPEFPQATTQPQCFDDIEVDSLDQVLDDFDEIQDFCGFGKAYYKGNEFLELNESLPTQKRRKTEESTKIDCSQTFGVLLKTTIDTNGIPQLEQNIQYLFGAASCIVKIENCKTLPDSRCILTISVSDAATDRKIPLADVLQLLSQPQHYQQFAQIFSSNLVRFILIQEVSEKDVEEYLSIKRKRDRTQTSGSELRDDGVEQHHTITTRTPGFSFKNRAIFVVLAVVSLAFLLRCYLQDLNKIEQLEKPEVRINLEHINKINQRYPNLISMKNMRMIRTRLAVMPREVSILILLGRSRDSHCKLDPTFCVGQAIVNVTQMQFGYIDASDPNFHSEELARELEDSLGGNKFSIMIDSLEKLPGSEVMTLFQYIDRDATHDRRGLLVFVVYRGEELVSENLNLKEADITERILLERWSPFIPKDSLTSVISRISGSIIKIH